jgi:hypothetical protein
MEKAARTSSLRIRKLRAILVIALLFQPPAAVAAGCDWQASFVSPGAATLSPALFKSIERSMPLASIVNVLGPATRESGSGLYILEWDVEDGRVFFVSATSACSKPLGLGFRGKDRARTSGSTPKAAKLNFDFTPHAGMKKLRAR